MESLRRSREFQQVFRVGKSVPGREIVLYGMRTRRPGVRIGFSLSKKVGGAVVRNRVRRRLREICRLHVDRLKPGWDLVIVGRSDAGAAGYADLLRAFQSQAQRLGCWGEPVPSRDTPALAAGRGASCDA